MSPSPESVDVMTCEGCAASIYREHIDRGLAGRWSGRLLCPHCLAEVKKPAAPAAAPPADLEHLSKADEAHPGGHSGHSSVHGHSGVAMAGLSDPEMMGYKRPLNPAGRGATRVRVFHCKLSEGPVLNLNQQVNEWLDAHPEVEIKFANTMVGQWEGKHTETHLILTLYY